MPIQTAAMFAPSLINLGMNLFGNNKKSPLEKKYKRMADLFETEGNQAITENRDFKSGMKIVDSYDKKDRRAINNQSAVTGATDEAKIATMQSANESRDSNINRLLQNAQRYRELMQNKAIRTRGLQHQAKEQRNYQFGQKVNSIVQPLGQATNAFMMSNMFGGSQPVQGMGYQAAAGLPQAQAVNAPDALNMNSQPAGNPYNMDYLNKPYELFG